MEVEGKLVFEGQCFGGWASLDGGEVSLGWEGNRSGPGQWVVSGAGGSRASVRV